MGERFGKFEIITKIATGGMAEIFLARQVGIEGFQKLIVLKRILPHLSTDKEFVNMFLDEARMAAQLNHPNIVQIYDLGVINDSYFIAMEFVDGVDLSSILKTGREKKSFLRLGWILKIISQVCEGLYYAHTLKDSSGQSLGLIHRDITPENILLSYNGNIKITDFGIARARGRSTSTTSGTLKGKFPYMSYEMVKGMEIDARSDIFSLGIVMWEMLTYRRLFKRDTEVASINAILNEEIPSPKKYFKNLPDEVEAIVMKALERDRTKRFQTAREMGNAIEDFIIKRRVVVRISDLSDYIKALFPDKEILSSREKLSSSKLQKIVDVKEYKSDNNSLPVITIQRKRSISENETVLLRPESSGNIQEVGEFSQLEDNENKQEVQIQSLSQIKPLSEVMSEIQVESTQKEELEKEIKKDAFVEDLSDKQKDSENDKEALVDQLPQNTFENKKDKKAMFLLAGVLISLFLLSGIIYFSIFSKEKTEGLNVISNISVNEDSRKKEIISKNSEGSTDLKDKETADLTRPDKEEAISTKEVIKTDSILKKKEQKVSVVEKIGVEKENKQKVENKEQRSEELQKVENKIASLEPKNGFLSIDSDPWTEIYIDGQRIGETPLVRYELPAGNYSVLLKNSEFGFEKPIKVIINPEENSVNKIRFGKGFLNVNTNKPVEVRLGANLLGKTPLSNIDMYEGIYRITIFDPEQNTSRTIKIEIKEGKTTTINQNL